MSLYNGKIRRNPGKKKQEEQKMRKNSGIRVLAMVLALVMVHQVLSLL